MSGMPGAEEFQFEAERFTDGTIQPSCRTEVWVTIWREPVVGVDAKGASHAARARVVAILALASMSTEVKSTGLLRGRHDE